MSLTGHPPEGCMKTIYGGPLTAAREPPLTALVGSAAPGTGQGRSHRLGPRSPQGPVGLLCGLKTGLPASWRPRDPRALQRSAQPAGEAQPPATSHPSARPAQGPALAPGRSPGLAVPKPAQVPVNSPQKVLLQRGQRPTTLTLLAWRGHLSCGPAPGSGGAPRLPPAAGPAQHPAPGHQWAGDHPSPGHTRWGLGESGRGGGEGREQCSQPGQARPGGICKHEKPTPRGHSALSQRLPGKNRALTVGSEEASDAGRQGQFRVKAATT